MEEDDPLFPHDDDKNGDDDDDVDNHLVLQVHFHQMMVMKLK